MSSLTAFPVHWIAELYLYGGHLLLVSFWSSVIYAYVETLERDATTPTSLPLLADKETAAFASLTQEERDEDEASDDDEEEGEGEGEGDEPSNGPLPSSSLLSLPPTHSSLARLRWTYCIGYLLMMAGDWLQGPYMYELYRHYGYSAPDIGVLFIAGFASSAVFGSLVASLADVWGKKNFVLLYALVYVASCLTKHSPDYATLMAGRVMGGIATSILFSAFESWLINVSKQEADRVRDYGRVTPVSKGEGEVLEGARGEGDDEGAVNHSKWLAVTFSYAGQVNSAVAIGSGLVGEAANMWGGPVLPFDLAAVGLTLGAVFVALYWQNDYLSAEQRAQSMRPTSAPSWWSVWRSSLGQVLTSPSMVLVGVIQSCFEGSMYLFIFMWSPVLVSTLAPPNPHSATVQAVWHGWVFAGFMVCAWCGSYLFSYGIGRAQRSLEGLGHLCMVSAALSIAAVPFLTGLYPRLVAFSAFELCVGVFWPYMGSMREKYIRDEAMRATCMTLYRIPLNCIVVAVLLNIERLSELHLCALTATGLGVAALANLLLVTRWTAAPT